MMPLFRHKPPHLKTAAALSACMGIYCTGGWAWAEETVKQPPKQQSEAKIPEWYAKKVADLANPGTHLGDMLVKVESWLDMAEANPAATVSFPPENPKAKDAKPRVYPAKQLAEQGMVKLRQGFGSPPQGALAPERLEIAWARVALMENHPEIAAKTLLPYEVKDISSATPERKEALVWLVTARLRLLVSSAQPANKKVADPAALADWLGLPMDWAAGIPFLSQGEGKSKPSDQVQALLETTDTLVAATEGPAQVRAAMVVGDAFGLQGKWSQAIGSYGFVIGQTNYINHRASTYSIDAGDKPKRAVPGNLIYEAKAKQAQAGRIAELIRYSAEFILYRDGHWQMLHGQYANATGTFEKLLAVAEKKRKESHDQAIAKAIGEAKKNNQSADKAQKEAEKTWREQAKQGGLLESPFEAAAKVYAEKCRLALGDPKNEALAVRNLQKFVTEDPDGIYRGEALQAIATCAMDNFAFDAAKPWLEKWDGWVKKNREKMEKEKWNFADKLPGIAEAAGPMTQAPQKEYNKANFWGKVSRVTIHPGQLVCEKNCAWYLDNLEEDLVLYQGFLLFIQNDTPKGRAEAKAKWERLKELDPLSKNDGPTNPTNLTRLRTWCNTGNGYATPPEAAVFKGRARQIQCWADFLCATCQWGRAERVGKRMADNKAWPVAQREYGLVVWASGVSRQGRKREAFFIYKQALATIDKTPSELRCWYSAAQIACCSLHGKGDADLRKEGRAMLEKMAKARMSGEWGCKAIIGLACELSQQKKYDEAFAMLDSYPDKTDRWAKIIDLYRQSITHAKEVNTP